MLEFMGYKRPDGTVGVRNHVLIIPTCACSADVAALIGRDLCGAVVLHNQNGCGQVAGDSAMTLKLLAGLAANPNVYGVLLVGLGCEQLHWRLVKEAIRLRTQKPVEAVEIQRAAAYCARWLLEKGWLKIYWRRRFVQAGILSHNRAYCRHQLRRLRPYLRFVRKFGDWLCVRPSSQIWALRLLSAKRRNL